LAAQKDRWPRADFLGRILLFAFIYAALQGLLEYVRTSEVLLISIVSNFIAGILLALVLSLSFLQLPFTKKIRIGVAWLALFIIQEFSNLVEGYFFTTFLPTLSLFLAAALIGLLVTFVEALLVGILFVSKELTKSFREEIKKYFDQASRSSWTLCIVAASLVYFPIYFAFGALISPIAIPYYQDSTMGLRIPSFAVMVPLEFVRGFLYVLALLPFIAILQVRREYVYAGTASLLYVAGAFAPFLAGSALPVQLRAVHGLEILGDCLVYGAALVYLLNPGRSHVGMTKRQEAQAKTT
jgi:hypothetical protein